MKTPRWFSGLGVFLLLGVVAAGCGRPRAAVHAATTPVPNENRAERTAQLTQRSKAAASTQLVFLGDSITEGWEAAGADVWAERFAAHDALNLGVGGDRTEHVLHRLELGQVDGLSPRAVVLMIGTNNTAAGHTPEQIADGIEAILAQLETRLPDARVLLLAVFPRGPDGDAPGRRNNAAVNALIAPLADGVRIVFLDIGDAFLEADGTLSQQVMPDLLHLSPRGYGLWADAMGPALEALLTE